MAAAKVVWDGPKQLRKLLVPIEQLTPHPRNPRVGNVNAIAASLERFGQRKSIAADSTGVVTAGNGTRLAALQLGWTHLAAVLAEPEDDGQRDAFVLADNRTHDLGTYDEKLLVELIGEQLDAGDLAGVGYTADDYADMLARIERDAAAPVAPVERGPSADDQIREVVLTLTAAQHRDFARWVGMLRKEWSVEGITEIVVRAVKDAAKARG